MSESQRTAQESFVVDPSEKSLAAGPNFVAVVVATLLQVIVSVVAAVVALSKVVGSAAAAVVALPHIVAVSQEFVVVRSSDEIVVAELDNENEFGLRFKLSVAFLLLLLLPEDSAILVATGRQVLGVPADVRLWLTEGWVVWSPMASVMIAAMAMFGSSYDSPESSSSSCLIAVSSLSLGFTPGVPTELLSPKFNELIKRSQCRGSAS